MSDSFWEHLPLLIASVGGLVTTIIGLWKSNKRIDHLGDKVETIHKATNGMQDALVKVTGEAEHAKGKLEGQAEAQR